MTLGKEQGQPSPDQEKAPTTIALAEQVVLSYMSWIGNTRNQQLAHDLVTHMPPQFIKDLGVLSIAAQNVTSVDTRQLNVAKGNYWEATKIAFNENLVDKPDGLILRAMIIVNAAHADDIDTEACIRPYDYLHSNVNQIASVLGLKNIDEPVEHKHILKIEEIFEKMINAQVLVESTRPGYRYPNYSLNQNVQIAFGDVLTAIYAGELHKVAELYKQSFNIYAR
jgi:hypothetical protein